MPKIAKWILDSMESTMPSKFPVMEVVEIEDISTTVVKMRFKGNLKGLNFQIGYALPIRVTETEYRNYTASYADEENGILEIIFHLHGTAVGCNLIKELKIGDKIRIGMPRGPKWYDKSVKKYLIFGDETALSLACAFNEKLEANQHKYEYYFELDKQNEEAPKRMGLKNYTVFTKANSFKNENWISQLPIFQKENWFLNHIVLVGNVKSIQTFRKVIKQHNSNVKILLKGYWTEGKNGL